MSDLSLEQLQYQFRDLQKQVDKIERSAEEAKTVAARAREDAQRAFNDAFSTKLSDNEKLWVERFDRVRSDINVSSGRLNTLETDTKKDRDALNVAVADIKALREDKSDQKALMVFIRNSIIGVILSIAVTWFLHTSK